MPVLRTIIEASIKKDEQACRSLYNEYIPYVYSIVKRYIWQQENRKDIIQNIFAQVFKNLQQFDEEKGNFNTWIRRISINECLMKIRKEEKQAFIVPISEKESSSHFEKINPDALTRKDIEKILAKMPKGYRTIFLLSVIDEYSHDEISEIMNISRETSRSQLSRAKNWMKKHFFSNENALVDGIF